MKQYFALCASLPVIKMEETPSLSSEKFFYYCSAHMSENELKTLESVSLSVRDLPENFSKKSLFYKYASWDISLRAALAKTRAARLSFDIHEFPESQKEIAYEMDAEKTASDAYSQTNNPLERERFLDRARWNKLEELEPLYHFTYDHLCAYRLQLLIAEKWQKRAAGNARKNLDDAARLVRSGETA